MLQPNIKLLEDKIAVRLDPLEEVTKGGLILPDPQRRAGETRYGEVVAVGPGRRREDGFGRSDMTVVVGDRVAISSFGGSTLVVLGEDEDEDDELVVLLETEVIAILLPHPVSAKNLRALQKSK